MKILAYTSPARGHLFPLVPTLDQLAGRGHAVALLTLSAEVERMRDRGFDASPIAQAIEAVEHDDYRGRTPASAMKRAMATFLARSREEVADLRAAIARHEPDALLVDCMTWGATAVAEAWGGPWAQWFPYPLPLPSPDVPPFGPGLRPAAGPLGRLRDALLRPAISGAFARATLPQVNATRRLVGVPPFRTASELFTTPPLLLYMTAEPFEYPRSDWPANIRMVGPGVWDPPSDPPPWLDELRKPLVMVSTSSEYQDDGRLVRATLDALADEDLSVVATLPSADLRGSVPANARVERFVPHGPIIARAACVVTHGGAGATQKALAAAVPVCVVPFGRDQLEVARRVEVSGAGTYLPLRHLRPDRLRSAIHAAMTTKREGARRVAEGYAASGGASAAADAVEGLVAGWAGGPPLTGPAA
ncbi:MAG TPA: nucleotide disphospho-sugar-binding domain-containing protein [Solirubrobacteraceae bacterium]|nr:nucleotide disphospho-sugar-binding domain-containing protein [Solirubrobacteraceae bacterium]